MAASREEVFERVKEVLTEQLGVEEGDINDEASFQEDLDADSLDLVELIMELEDQFGIKISDEVGAHYPGLDRGLLRDCRILMLAMITAWRWDRDDQLPDGRRLGSEWLSQIRAELDPPS